MKRFSDFCKETLPLDGEKVKIETIVDKEILVTGYKITSSKQNEGEHCLTLQFQEDAQTMIVFTGSKVLIEQIEKYNSEIPFLTTIRKINRYYSFS